MTTSAMVSWLLIGMVSLASVALGIFGWRGKSKSQDIETGLNERNDSSSRLSSGTDLQGDNPTVAYPPAVYQSRSTGTRSNIDSSKTTHRLAMKVKSERNFRLKWKLPLEGVVYDIFEGQTWELHFGSTPPDSIKFDAILFDLELYHSGYNYLVLGHCDVRFLDEADTPWRRYKSLVLAR